MATNILDLDPTKIRAVLVEDEVSETTPSLQIIEAKSLLELALSLPEHFSIKPIIFARSPESVALVDHIPEYLRGRKKEVECRYYNRDITCARGILELARGLEEESILVYRAAGIYFTELFKYAISQTKRNAAAVAIFSERAEESTEKQLEYLVGDKLITLKSDWAYSPDVSEGLLIFSSFRVFGSNDFYRMPLLCRHTGYRRAMYLGTPHLMR